MYPPRQGDLPVRELMERANSALKEFSQFNPEVYFKFTCKECGERCVLEEPNHLYQYSVCAKCGYNNKIERGGFALKYTLPGEKKQHDKQDETNT
jgi:hypothetical protein